MLTRSFRASPIVGVALVFLALGFAPSLVAEESELPAPTIQDRWFYVSSNINTDEAADYVVSLVRRAGAVNLNGMLWSTGWDWADEWTEDHIARFERVKAAAEESNVEIIPILWSVGYGTMTGKNPNLAEGLPVRGLPMVAREGRLVFEEEPIKVPGGDMESWKSENALAISGFQDRPGEVSFRDESVAREGKSSIRFENLDSDKYGHGRLMWELELPAGRVYRASVQLKAEKFIGRPLLQAYSMDGDQISVGQVNGAKADSDGTVTFDWQKAQVVFRVPADGKIRLYAGVWGGKTGKIWVDDLRVEPIGLVNPLQRPGTPITIASADGKKVYEQGEDWTLPEFRVRPWNLDAEPVEPILPEGSAIKDGDEVRVDFYYPPLVGAPQIGTCMSEPELYERFEKSAEAVVKLLNPQKWFLSMDEIRCAGTCKACKDRGISLAAILADCIAKQRGIIKKARPDADVYIWSDMLDPNHNAHDKYYVCDGDYTGVWDLIPNDLIIACWWYDKREISMKFFSERGFRTLGAAYYDTDDLDGCADWLDVCNRTPGCVGIMYTTWQNKYELMEGFGEMLSREPLVIYDANSPLDEASFRRQGCDAKRLDDGALLIENGDKDRWPGVHFTGNWDLSDYSALEMELESTCDNEFVLFFRIDSEGYDPDKHIATTTKSLVVKPGEKKTWRTTFSTPLNPETRAKLIAMRGKPGGIKTDSYTRDQGSPIDMAKIVAFRPFVNQDQKNDSWKLTKLVAIPRLSREKERDEYLTWGPDKFFPMIDQFGQFIHKDWPGKVKSLEDLRSRIAEEDADLNAYEPVGFDKYGGWLDGPQLEATGSFRTEKVDGVWYLVDPEGRLFWSNGIDCVSTWTAVTPVTDREFFFSDPIPTKRDSENPLSRFLSEASNGINNYYANFDKYLQYNFTESNLYLKYGDDWREKNVERIKRRLPSWGINTIGNWSNSEIARAAKIPYVATLNTGGRRIEGSEGYWGKFVDPFAPEFKESVVKAIERAKYAVDDPYCVGFFVDNEIGWGGEGSLAKAALASPKDQPVKIAFVEWLKEKYASIDALNKAWRVELADWDALASEPFDAPNGDSDAAKDDFNAFYTVICEKYFSEIASAIRENAPNRLYLGCRFAWTNDLARAAGQKYCDVVSYNYYKDEISWFQPVEGEDKPVIIGEFHFGALDRGLFHEGLCPRPNQEERARAYENYVKSALSNPWIVGAHWFEYQDEATTGRFDGENYQIGFVDVCDNPYPETIAAARRVGANLYKLRKETALSTDRLLEETK